MKSYCNGSRVQYRKHHKVKRNEHFEGSCNGFWNPENTSSGKNQVLHRFYGSMELASVWCLMFAVSGDMADGMALQLDLAKASWCKYECQSGLLS